MAALVDTCWANGVWADPVWAVGVWASSSSPPVVVTATTTPEKDGGWHGIAHRMKKHRQREAALEVERQSILKKIMGETQHAYAEVRRERKDLPDVVLAPVKQAVRPFAQRPGIPQAKDIDWAKLALGGLDEAVEALSAAMAQGREKQRREFEQHISALTRQLEAVEKEHARVIRELEELDDEEAIELILHHLN